MRLVVIALFVVSLMGGSLSTSFAQDSPPGLEDQQGTFPAEDLDGEPATTDSEPLLPDQEVDSLSDQAVTNTPAPPEPEPEDSVDDTPETPTTESNQPQEVFPTPSDPDAGAMDDKTAAIPDNPVLAVASVSVPSAPALGAIWFESLRCDGTGELGWMGVGVLPFFIDVTAWSNPANAQVIEADPTSSSGSMVFDFRDQWSGGQRPAEDDTVFAEVLMYFYVGDVMHYQRAYALVSGCSGETPITGHFETVYIVAMTCSNAQIVYTNSLPGSNLVVDLTIDGAYLDAVTIPMEIVDDFTTLDVEVPEPYRAAGYEDFRVTVSVQYPGQEPVALTARTATGCADPVEPTPPAADAVWSLTDVRCDGAAVLSWSGLPEDQSWESYPSVVTASGEEFELDGDRRLVATAGSGTATLTYRAKQHSRCRAVHIGHHCWPGGRQQHSIPGGGRGDDLWMLLARVHRNANPSARNWLEPG